MRSHHHFAPIHAIDVGLDTIRDGLNDFRPSDVEGRVCGDIGRRVPRNEGKLVTSGIHQHEKAFIVGVAIIDIDVKVGPGNSDALEKLQSGGTGDDSPSLLLPDAKEVDDIGGKVAREETIEAPMLPNICGGTRNVEWTALEEPKGIVVAKRFNQMLVQGSDTVEGKRRLRYKSHEIL